MKPLYKIFESIILEGVSPDIISKTIGDKKMARITYNGDGNNSKGVRTIVPFLYGLHNSGQMMIRAWQLGGDTDTKIYKWKTFITGSISSWEVRNGNAKSVLTALRNASDLPDYVGKSDKDFDEVYAYIPVSDYMSDISDRPSVTNQFEPNVDKADGTTTDIKTQTEPIEVSNDDISNDEEEIIISPELENEFLSDNETSDDDNDDENNDELEDFKEN